MGHHPSKDGAPRPFPVAPTVEVWRAMTPEAQRQFLLEANEIIAERRSWEREKAAAELASERAGAMAAKEEAARAVVAQAVTAIPKAILFLLQIRGILCPDEARSQIASCQDMATLQRWLLRATTAGSVDEVLAG